MFTEAFPIVTTPDLPRLIAFYRDVVGFELIYRFPDDGEPEFVALRLGNSELGLAADPEAGTPAHAHRWELCVYADDCDTAVNALRSGGATVTEEPIDQPWGERSARVTDPDGNHLLVLSRLP
ncbi:VOC family protein [Micromonospora sp. LH3U1]|uniref:VOC family protein n=1 Tax=Micromonospora sp. LH3U1 TaxID=3018339 RepID=UPI00234AA625|nr:VOC family protein [Micromonospora sp. LH3U1]WCN81618.1 VOC family protein [Micromonospora sp. LH3U1]